jgi:predicted ABC-type ATPase
MENWAKEASATGRRYGNIVFLETGTGKTYIAIMLLKAIFYEGIENLSLSQEEIREYAKATECGAKLEPLKDLKKKYEDRVNHIEKKLDTLEQKIAYNNSRKIVSLLILTKLSGRIHHSNPKPGRAASNHY